MFAWREMTLRALNHAFGHHREVVLAVQRRADVDEPGFEDIHEIGVLARLIQSDRQDDGTLRVFVEAHRRVVICRFLGEMGAFEAEISDRSEGPVPYAPDLILRAIALFERYAAARQIQMRQTWPTLRQTRDPGRAADMIATYLALPDRRQAEPARDPRSRGAARKSQCPPGEQPLRCAGKRVALFFTTKQSGRRIAGRLR